jgi:hypothetical protein
MESFNEATNLANNSIYQEFEEKASIKTIIKSEQSTIKSSNNKRNETFPQIVQKNEICKIVPTSGMPISKSCIINSNVSFSQYFLKKENVNTSQITDLSNWKSSNYFLYYLYGIYELSLALFNPNTISKDLKVFQESPKKNDFFGQGEINSFGIVIIYDINKINDEYYKYEFHKITNLICASHDHFRESVCKLIESIKNIYIYVDLRLYSESEQLNEGYNKSINEKDVMYLYINNSFVYSLNFNNSLINNFNNIKINIDLRFYKNTKCGSSFEKAFAKIINEYSIIHQITKDALIKGYFFILFQEKKELYKVISLLKKREIRILYSILSEHNLIDEFLDKKNAERIQQIEQSDYLIFCNNNKIGDV